MKQSLNMLAQNTVTGDLLAAVLEVRAGTGHAVGLIGLAAFARSQTKHHEVWARGRNRKVGFTPYHRR